MLDDVGNAIDASMTGAKGGFFDGGRFIRNWNKVKKTFGEDALRETLGSDHVDALNRVSQIHNAPVGSITKWMRTHKMNPYLLPAAGAAGAHMIGVPWYMGAVAGTGADLMARQVTESILSSPKIANHLLFAVDSGANPKNYVPMIANLIVQAAQKQQQEGNENANQ
jgi:hypothetical protein